MAKMFTLYIKIGPKLTVAHKITCNLVLKEVQSSSCQSSKENQNVDKYFKINIGDNRKYFLAEPIGFSST